MYTSKNYEVNPFVERVNFNKEVVKKGNGLKTIKSLVDTIGELATELESISFLEHRSSGQFEYFPEGSIVNLLNRKNILYNELFSKISELKGEILQ